VSADAAVDTAGWERLSPKMLLIHPVNELIRLAPALLGLFIAGIGSGQGVIFAAGGAALAVALGLTRWFTTTYRIGPDQVQVRSGLLKRELRSVSRDRVRTVDVTASLMHRILGVAKVEIGTGRNDRGRDGSLALNGLEAGDAAALRATLLHRAAAAQPAPAPAVAADPDAPTTWPPPAPVTEPEDELARLDPRWIRYGPFTLSGLVTIGIVAAVAARVVSEAHIDPEDYGPFREAVRGVTDMPLGLTILIAVIVVLVLVALLSTVGYVLAYWNYRLTRHPGGTLHVARGLLTTRATSIEERRLHGVTITRPLLLRAVGAARTSAIATGLRGARGGSLLLPPAPVAEADRVAAAVLQDAAPVTAALRAHGPKARQRRYTRALTVAALLPILGAVAWLALDWSPLVPLIALVALPVAVALAADRYRALGHAVVDGHLVTRAGSIVQRRSALATGGVIGVTIRRSFFQRRVGLATLEATTAAGVQRYAVRDVAHAQALDVAEQVAPGLVSAFAVPSPRGLDDPLPQLRHP
jgi:putative membrane protein